MRISSNWSCVAGNLSKPRRTASCASTSLATSSFLIMALSSGVSWAPCCRLLPSSKLSRPDEILLPLTVAIGVLAAAVCAWTQAALRARNVVARVVARVCFLIMVSGFSEPRLWPTDTHPVALRPLTPVVCEWAGLTPADRRVVPASAHRWPSKGRIRGAGAGSSGPCWTSRHAPSTSCQNVVG